MLVFALEYRQAIDRITGDRDMRKYELLEEEWGLVQQLCDVYEYVLLVFPFSTQIFADFQGCNSFLFSCNTQSAHRDSCHESH